jgi:hypothetical protein
LLKSEPFKTEDKKAIDGDYISGRKYINLTSTGLVFIVLSKILTLISQTLDTLYIEKKFTKRNIQKFIIEYSKLEVSGYFLYSAI